MYEIGSQVEGEPDPGVPPQGWAWTPKDFEARALDVKLELVEWLNAERHQGMFILRGKEVGRPLHPSSLSLLPSPSYPRDGERTFERGYHRLKVSGLDLLQSPLCTGVLQSSTVLKYPLYLAVLPRRPNPQQALH